MDAVKVYVPDLPLRMERDTLQELEGIWVLCLKRVYP